MITAQERVRIAAQRSDAGYGLVSVLVALVLLSVGVLSVSSVLTQSLALQTVSSQRANALYIAQAGMEEIRGLEPTAIAAQSAIAVNEDGIPDVNGLFTYEVAVDSAGRNLIGVIVTVRAPRSDPIRLVTWIYDGEY